MIMLYYMRTKMNMFYCYHVTKVPYGGSKAYKNQKVGESSTTW